MSDGWWTYYREWGKRASRGPLGITQIIALLVGITCGAIACFTPKMDETLRFLVWFIPACALLVFMVIAWHRGSYELYQEADGQRKKTETSLSEAMSAADEKQNKLLEQIENNQADRKAAQFAYDCLCKCLDDANELYSQDIRGSMSAHDRDEWIEQCKAWHEESSEAIRDCVSVSGLRRFQNNPRKHSSNIEEQRRHKSGSDLEWLIRLADYMDNLKELIAKYDDHVHPS